MMLHSKSACNTIRCICINDDNTQYYATRGTTTSILLLMPIYGK